MFSSHPADKSIRAVFYYWLDYDAACYELALLLGIEEAGKDFTTNKHLWCTSNPINDMLGTLLESMVQSGILKKNEDIQFRYNQEFRL